MKLVWFALILVLSSALVFGCGVESVNGRSPVNWAFDFAEESKKPHAQTGTSYYVDGKVTASGDGSIHAPFKTIQEALDVAGAGDSVYIFGGTYRESYLQPHGGTAENWLTIANMPGEEVILDGGWPNRRNDNAFWIHQPDMSYIEINGLKIANYYDILYRTLTTAGIG